MIRAKSKFWFASLIAISLFAFSFFTRAEDLKAYPLGLVTGTGYINIRKTSQEYSPVVGHVRGGETYAVEKIPGRYVILNGPHAGGFIHESFIQLTGEKFPIGKTNADSIRIRNQPNTTGKIMGTVGYGAKLVLQKRDESWYEIKAGPQRGNFIAAQFVTGLDQVSPVINISEVPLLGVKKDTGPVVENSPNSDAASTSDSPGTSSPSPAPAAPETTTETQQPAAEPTTAAAPAVPQILSGKTKGTSIRVRGTPNTQGKIMGTLNNNVPLQVERAGSDWFKILAGSQKGNFVSSQFVELSKNSISESGAAPNSGSVANGTVTSGAGNSGSVNSGVANPNQLPQAMTTTPTGGQNSPIISPAPPSWDEETEKRFQDQVAKAFKNRVKTSDREVLMPVFYEKYTPQIGDIQTLVNESGVAKFDAASFLALLRKVVAPKWFEKPEAARLIAREQEGKTNPERAWMTANEFEGTGVTVLYNQADLSLEVRVPPELRAVGVQSLIRSQYGFGNENFESLPLFNSYLNINAAESLDQRQEAYKDTRTPVRAQLENGTRLGRFVFEGYGTYTEDRGDNLPDGAEPFRREDLRMVYDIPSLVTRLSAGDLVYPTYGYQIYRPMAGVAAVSQFSMSPSKLTYPTGDYEVFLKRNSKVYIYVNDQLQQILELPAGRHQIRDFPYTNGSNNVRFEIHDDVGQIETLNYNYFSSTELLRPNLHQFSYAAGQQSETASTGERIYKSESTFSAAHRTGVSETFTAGINAQQDPDQTVAGIETLWSTKIGYVKLEPGYSQSKTIGTGQALGIKYSHVDYKGKEKTQRSTNVNLIVRSSSFSTLGNDQAGGLRRKYDLTMNHNRGINKMLSASVGFNYRINKKPDSSSSNSFSLFAGITKRWANGLSLNTSMTHTRADSGGDQLGVMAFLIWSFPEDKQVITAVHNSSDSSSRLDWSYSPDTGADAVNGGATLRESKIEKAYGGQITHNGNRARSLITHEVVIPKADKGTVAAEREMRSNNVTTLQMGTAIVFAGGHLAIGRPVADSFAILSPTKSLRGQTLEVNPDNDGNYQARSTWLGPAVMSELGSYTATSLVVRGRDLPVGLSVPQDHFELYPRYKSGYGFGLGTEATVYLVMTVRKPDGKSVGVLAGEAHYLDGGEEPTKVSFFTNRRGQIRSEGFRPGRYKIDLDPEKYEPLEFVIPKADSNEIDLGTMTLKVKAHE